MDFDFLILTNRGHFKAYRTVQHYNQHLNLEAIDEVDFVEAHQRISDRVSDQAGRNNERIPGEGVGHPSSYGDKTNLELETRRRLDEDVAERIENLVGKSHQPWVLAAPDALLVTLKNLLTVPTLANCVGMIPKDIVNEPVAEVRDHVKEALEQRV
jgi:hypothetical protein